MACVDMSVEKLKEYKGRNPRPADFDEFWNEALAEMNSIEPNAEFKPYDFPSRVADFFELTFTSTKGARIYAKVARPKKLEGKAPAILKFHGLSGDGGEWNSLLRYACEGFVIASMDCRGQGGRSTDAGGTLGTTHTTQFVRGLDGDPKDLHCRELFLDTAMLARIIMGLDFVDEKRVGAMGGSQGGALTVACAALVPSIFVFALLHILISRITSACLKWISTRARMKDSDIISAILTPHTRARTRYLQSSDISIFSI